jgi:hypothetical protein
VIALVEAGHALVVYSQAGAVVLFVELSDAQLACNDGIGTIGSDDDWRIHVLPTLTVAKGNPHHAPVIRKKQILNGRLLSKLSAIANGISDKDLVENLSGAYESWRHGPIEILYKWNRHLVTVRPAERDAP